MYKVPLTRVQTVMYRYSAETRHPQFEPEQTEKTRWMWGNWEASLELMKDEELPELINIIAGKLAIDPCRWIVQKEWHPSAATLDKAKQHCSYGPVTVSEGATHSSSSGRESHRISTTFNTSWEQVWSLDHFMPHLKHNPRARLYDLIAASLESIVGDGSSWTGLTGRATGDGGRGKAVHGMGTTLYDEADQSPVREFRGKPTDPASSCNKATIQVVSKLWGLKTNTIALISARRPSMKHIV
jgi:hypothetical protein